VTKLADYTVRAISGRRAIALILAVLAVSPPGLSQTREPAAPNPKAADLLKIFVLQGDRAVNSISTRTAVQPIIEVRDERNRPVQGAKVLFQLPAAGPAAFFPGQKLGWSGKTDANGQVAAAELIPNGKSGPFRIQVNATYGDRAGHAFIEQTNRSRSAGIGSRVERKRSGWWKAALVIGAAAAAGGIVWATQRGNERPTVVFQPGTVSIGGPR